MKFINKEGPRDHSWVVSYGIELVHLYASSEGAARQKAVEHWKLKKKHVPLLSIACIKQRTDLVHVS